MILVQQRAQGTHLAGAWEFPGGKVEEDESWEEALAREVQEELGVPAVAHPLFFAEKPFSYPEKTVRLRFYWTQLSGEPKGPSLRWVSARELLDLEVPEANRELIPAIARELTGVEDPDDRPPSIYGVLVLWLGLAAFVVAALVFLTIDGLFHAFGSLGRRDPGRLLEDEFAVTRIVGGDRAIFLGVFFVVWGLLAAWVRHRTARRRPS